MRRSEKRKSEEKEDAGAHRKVAIHCFSNDLWLRGSKSRLTRAAGAEPAGQMRDEKLHARVARSTCPSQNVQSTPLWDHFLEVEMSKKRTLLWPGAHVQVKMYKAHPCRTTFGSWDVEKVHVIVARSKFPSQKCKKLTVSDHFWTFRCRFAWQGQGIVHLVKSE